MSESLFLSLEPKHVLILAGIIAVVLIISVSKVADILKANAREQTRREVAAYVAEGSMDADQADRLLGLEQSDAEKKITDAVAWGMISTNKAERLIRTLRERQHSAEHSKTA